MISQHLARKITFIYPTCGSETARSGRCLETVWSNAIQSISRVESFAIFSRSNFGVCPEWLFLNFQTVSRTWHQSQSRGVSRTGPGGVSWTCSLDTVWEWHAKLLTFSSYWNSSGYSSKVGLEGFISWDCWSFWRRSFFCLELNLIWNSKKDSRKAFKM